MVTRVGGLADTVIDANEEAVRSGVATGIVADPDEAGLGRALRRTAALWRNKPAWAQAQRAGMAADMGWTASAARYAAVLARVIGPGNCPAPAVR